MSIHLRILAILTVLQAHLLPVCSQFNQTETFTFADGLAMTECDQVYCDRAGRIWVQHSTGWISAFDGRSFATYSPEQIGSLSGGGEFAEDRQGLWILKNRSISLFAHEKWKTWSIPLSSQIIIDKELNRVDVQDSSQNLLTLDTISLQWKIYSQLPPNPSGGESRVVGSRFENNYLLIQFDHTQHWQPQKTFISHSLSSPQWVEEKKEILQRPEWTYHHISPSMDSLISNIIPEKFNGFRIQYITTSLNKRIFAHIAPDPESHNFITWLYAADDKNDFRLLASFVTGHNNLSIAFDQMDNVWVASQKGLQRIYTNILQCFDNRKDMVPSLHVINEDEQGRIWFGGYNSGFCYFDDGQLHPSPVETTPYKSFLPGGYRDAKGNMAFWTEDYWLTVYHNNIWSDAKTMKGEGHREVGYCFIPIRNHQVASGLQGFGIGITQLPLTATSKWSYISKDKGMFLDNVLTITEDGKGRLWAGRSSQGIAVYDPLQDTAQTWLMEKGSALNYGMMSSVLDAEGRLWMGCTDGIRVMENPSSFTLFKDDFYSMTHKMVMDQAGYSFVGFITIYKNFIVFGNQTGYGFIDLSTYQKTPLTPRIFFYPTQKFGMSSEQNAVLVDSNGYLWFGQDRGATRIEMRDNFLDSLPIGLSVKDLVIKDQTGTETVYTFDTNHQVRLPVKKRSITITLQPSFTGWLTDNVGIQYRLVHQKIDETSWSPYTRNLSIRFDYLPPGKNTLQVRAIKNNQVVNQYESIIVVPRILDENPWFWMGLFSFFSVAGFYLTRRIYRQRLHLRLTQINLAHQEREKNQFQISAVANSLNPHFIKNTLMWMQSRFRKDEEVVDVIDRLAYNINNVFAHSRNGKAFHSLGEEMKVTENFLAIQLATYGSFLKMTLPSEADIGPFKDIQVPLLLIQIHVENAIEHGLRKKVQGEKELIISLQDQDDYLQVIIEDNGIGRKAAKERGSQGTNQGTMMLDRIYELFNQQNEYSFSTKYDDLYDDQSGIAMGTRVQISIPKKYNLDLK